MDHEVYDKITTLQGVFESGHRENNIRLDKIYCYLSRDGQNKDITILKLKEIEKSYYSLKEEKYALEKVNHSLADKAHSYKLLSIVSTTLLLLAVALSFITV